MTQKEVGQRISTLRKEKGLSQDQLAKAVKISRSSVAQIELGNRGIDVFELCKLAQILNFSLDEFMSDEISAAPPIQTEKLHNILRYILEHCAGNPEFGKTELHQVLWMSDLYYQKTYNDRLAGPVPPEIDGILNKMIENKEVILLRTDYRGSPLLRYIPLLKADLTQLKASEKDVIDRFIRQS